MVEFWSDTIVVASLFSLFSRPFEKNMNLRELLLAVENHPSRQQLVLLSGLLSFDSITVKRLFASLPKKKKFEVIDLLFSQQYAEQLILRSKRKKNGFQFKYPKNMLGFQFALNHLCTKLHGNLTLKDLSTLYRFQNPEAKSSHMRKYRGETVGRYREKLFHFCPEYERNWKSWGSLDVSSVKGFKEYKKHNPLIKVERISPAELPAGVVKRFRELGPVIYKMTLPDGDEVEELLRHWLDNFNLGPKGKDPLPWIADTVRDFRTIHPFQNGNRRLSLLLLTGLLLNFGYTPSLTAAGMVLYEEDLLTRVRHIKEGFIVDANGVFKP